MARKKSAPRKRAAPKSPEGKQRLNLVCYCCGAPLANEIAIASASMNPERVFTFLPEHVHRVDGVWEIVCRDVKVSRNVGEG